MKKKKNKELTVELGSKEDIQKIVKLAQGKMQSAMTKMMERLAKERRKAKEGRSTTHEPNMK